MRHPLTAGQSAAVSTMNKQLNSRFPIGSLIGPAGTGKSTVVSQFVASHPDKKFLCVAPTHKAKDVLARAMYAAGVIGEQVTYATTARYLGQRMFLDETGTMRQASVDSSINPEDYDMIMADESSMHDDDTVERINLRAEMCPTLYIGDKKQLEPIESDWHKRKRAKENGGKFIAMSKAFQQYTPYAAELSQIVRTAADSPVPHLGAYLRALIPEDGDLRNEPVVLPTIQELLALECIKDSVSMQGPIFANPGRMTNAQIYKSFAARHREGVTQALVSYTNQSVIASNFAIHRLLHPDVPLFAPGDTVMLNEAYQDADDNVFENNSFWQVEEVSDETRWVSDVILATCGFNMPDGYDFEVRHVKAYSEDGGFLETWVPADEMATVDHRSAVSRLYGPIERLLGKDRKARWEGGPCLTRDERTQLNKLCQIRRNMVLTVAPLRHPYAITAHKSQGSTYERVYVDYANITRFHDPRKAIPSSSLRALYVAITRTSKELVLF